MANFLKFKVTEKVGDGYFGIGGLGAYRAGEVFSCTSEQAQRWIKLEDIAGGFIEPMGEDDGSAWSENIRNYLDGRQGFTDNTLPVCSISLTANTTPDVQGLELAGSLTLDRRVAVDKFLINHTTASNANTAPVLFVSAGHPVTVDATNVLLYDSDLDTYYTAASNTVAALVGGAAWGVNDLIMVGYTEKFSSIMWQMTAHSTGTAEVDALLYWNGTDWSEFAEYIDLTQEALGGPTLARAGNEDNTRMVWGFQPVDWVKGGPAGSAFDPDSYYVAARLTAGGLTSLAGAIPRPVLDTPLSFVSLGLRANAPEAIVTVIDGTTVDEEDTAIVLTGMDATDDYIYVGSPQLFRGLDVDMDANVNAVASTLSASYWNGRAWATVAITDGTTNAGVALAKDGAITIANLPFDWVSAVASEDLGFEPPATLSTEKLFWLRIGISAAVTDATGIAALYAIPPIETWIEFNAYPNSFVEAGEPFKIFVNDENAAAAGVEVKAIVMDV